ncbi:MAG TPA: prolyl oligopeptidase family serine peptidase [Gemmatimonadales bacterium]
MTIRARVLCPLLAVVALAGPANAQRAFSLDRIMSAPFPSGLTAGPTGFAWVQDDRGVRNIWVAVGPQYVGHALTTNAGDDGQEISDLQWTPDGKALAYVRGGGPNRQGEIPNPTSEPLGAERAIWLVALADGAPRKLAVGNGTAISPDGTLIAYVNRGGIWTVRIDTTGNGHHVVSPRGGVSSLSWAPDGSMLAFTSSRGDHSFIGVYRPGDSSLAYLDPSVDRDRDPAWSPDGHSLAFLRIPNQPGALPFSPRREAQPWSIRVVDVATGLAREVWHAEPGMGSAFQSLESGPALYWAGDRLVFPWERDGWIHLYAVPARGGTAVLLTPGAFEVEHVALTRDAREIIYSSNQDDVDRRHLWRVPVQGGTPRALTPGNGLEWSPVVDGAGTVALLASTGRVPAHAERLAGGARHPLAPGAIPADFPSDQLVEPEQVIFSSADGMRIHGQLFLPRGARRGERRPALLFFHGGSRRQMLLGFHYRGYYHNAYAMNQYLASKGYVVLSVNYRSGIGYGMEFREALNYGARGASEYRDVMGAGLYLRSRPDVDPERIGLWGGSYGGYLTALGLARSSDLFAAGVDFHGVHDWNVVIRNFVPSYDPRQNAEIARRAYESSPMASIDGWRSPVLLIHGDDDRNVPFSESVDLAAALRQRGVALEQLIFPDEIHGFLLHRSWMAAYRAAADFFDRKLAPGAGATR